MEKQEIVQSITGFVGKMLRARFGKGPEALNISLDNHSIVITLNRFTNPVEDELLAREDEKTFRYTRELLMKSLIPDIQTFFEQELGLAPMNFFYDWNVQKASGVIVGLTRNESEILQAAQDYPGRDSVHAQISGLLAKVQTTPSLILSWWIDPDTLLVFRKGIVILLEKEFHDLGHSDILKTAKRKLEKELLWQDAKIGASLGRTMSELFIDWDFGRDDSAIVCRFGR
ncbi:Na-translocating system protein MpsC family protein [Saccharibacillus sacchari]|uniref:Na-translocating system protein MpsC family protein n=1 Tax=Saccharibacillus sacchari TaxID=456493 RepID=A0ACC6PGU3_9BACL